MKVESFSDARTAAQAAANMIARHARQSIATRGRFVVAFSGGSTPKLMLEYLAHEALPWESVFVVQVDERIAPSGDAARNLTQLDESLLHRSSLPPNQVYAMPVEATDGEKAAELYQQTLREVAGSPPVLDLIHLGLGTDGHTASLVPGDPVLDVVHRDVAWSGVYQGHRRMTLTYAVINRARMIVWLVTGESKSIAVSRLCRGDETIPAGRIRRDNAILIADRAALTPAE